MKEIEIPKKQLKLKQTFLPLFLVALLVAVIIHGCVGLEKPKLKTLKIGYSQWPGFDVIVYGQEAGFFAKRGLDVKLVPFEISADSTKAVLRGSLDAGFDSLWQPMQLEKHQDSPVFLMVTDVSAGSDGIVTQKPIKSVKDLKGKKIGCKLRMVNELVLLEALKLDNINSEGIEIENIPNSIAAKRMKEGTLDGSVTWEPLLSNIAKEVEGNIIFTTKDVDSLVIDTLLTRSSYLSEHQQELTQFILAWFDIMDAIEREPEKVFATVAQRLDQNPESFAKDYAGLKKGDIPMQKRMFQTGGRLKEAMQEIVELFQQDQRFTSIISKDIKINAEPLNAAIEAWKP